MTEASAEKYDPDDLKTTAEASTEEAEVTTRQRERLERWRRQCVYGTVELMTTRLTSAE